MRSYTSLSGRGQLARLRRLGHAALARYAIDLHDARLTPLRHQQNATFRVDAPAGRFVLRISRPEPHTPASVASEMAWLAALRRDTGLCVPEPVAAADGSLVVSITDDGVPGVRLCALLRWIDGRFIDRGLTPAHLRRAGSLVAGLHDHAVDWVPPGSFVRQRVDTITTDGKAASFTERSGASAAEACPTPADGERATSLVRDLLSPSDAVVVERALDVVRGTTRTLGSRSGGFGLIHADLHQENVLHVGTTAGAIDFDDCGWGFHLYDLAVPLSELTARPRYPELRKALLEGYAARRTLAPDADAHIDAFIVLRGLQLLVWVLESREHAAFRDDWRPSARKELDWVASQLDDVAGR